MDNCPEISIEHYQKLIIKTKDRKKIGILIDDKLEELIDDYISKKDPESAIKKSEFFYELYQDGFDLNITCLNNSAYVFCSKLELDKAETMLNEAKHKHKTGMIDVRLKGMAPLVLYNYAILHVYHKKFKEAIEQFKEAHSFLEHNPDLDTTASIMRFLKITDQNEIKIEEIWADDSSDSSLNVKELINSNIELLEKVVTE